MALPAPYAPPWKRLGEDLLATLAWLRLRARELWRRNREGTLPVPFFWPRQWPQLFWPLAMAGVLFMALALARPLLNNAASQRVPVALEPPPLAESQPSEPAIPSPAAPEPALEVGAENPAALNNELSNLLEATSPAAQPEQTPGGDGPVPKDSARLSSAEGGIGMEAPPTEAPTAEELLAAEWQAVDPEGLIKAIRTEPGTGTVTLQLLDPFLALPLPKRQQWAELWQQQGTNSGYSHLRLADGTGRLLGRTAEVGTGVILLQPWQGPRVSP